MYAEEKVKQDQQNMYFVQGMETLMYGEFQNDMQVLFLRGLISPVNPFWLRVLRSVSQCLN